MTNTSAISRISTPGFVPIAGESTIRLGKYLLASGDLPNDESVYHELHRDRALAIIRKCGDPTAATRSVTSLAIGYVQSGKTISMATLACVARDNGYRIIIVLAGTTKNLVVQSRDRFATYLRAAAGTNFTIWDSLENVNIQNDVPTLRSLVGEWQGGITPDHHSRTLFVTVMKHFSHLQRLRDVLSFARIENTPVLIVDDEADQAGLNNSPDGPQASTTYSHIDMLRSAARNHAYVQYTATPQAPLLISISDTLAPERVTILSAGAAYTGGTKFFRQPGLSQYVTQIPNDEIQTMSSPSCVDPPESLQDALKLFLLGVGLGRLQRDDDDPKRKRSMLVHPSRLKNDHSRFFNWVNRLKQRWETQLRSGPGTVDWRNTTGEFEPAYTSLATTVADLPPLADLLVTMRWAIGQVMVVVVNSDNASEVRWQNGYAHILVGGDKLNRGYTVEGLTVTYMPRWIGEGTVDTVQQRARFFGYKQRYIGLCRIFLERAVYDAYVAYVDHEERMRAHLADFEEQPLANWKRAFYLEPGLSLTRKSVISDPVIGFRVDGGGWFNMKAPHVSAAAVIRNRELANLFVSSHTFGVFAGDNRKANRHGAALVPVRHVLEKLLLDFHVADYRDAAALCAINCVMSDLLADYPPLEALVLLMDDLRERERTADRTDRINLHQGRGSSTGTGYKGDAHMHDTDRITVQIHKVRVTSAAGEDVPDVSALSVWFPRTIANRFIMSQPSNVA